MRIGNWGPLLSHTFVNRRLNLSLSVSYAASGGRVEETGFVVDYRGPFFCCLFQKYGDVLCSREAMPTVKRRCVDRTF